MAKQEQKIDISRTKRKTILGDSIWEGTMSIQGRGQLLQLPIEIHELPQGQAISLETPKGRYIIEKHETINAFIGIAGSVKIRVTLETKRGVSSVTYWSES